MLKLKFRKIDLNNLKTEKVWNNLLDLTVEGWTAKLIFEEIKKGYKRKVATLYSLWTGNKMIAWSFVIKDDYNDSVWTFTHPDYRQQGL